MILSLLMLFEIIYEHDKKSWPPNNLSFKLISSYLRTKMKLFLKIFYQLTLIIQFKNIDFSLLHNNLLSYSTKRPFFWVILKAICVICLYYLKNPPRLQQNPYFDSISKNPPCENYFNFYFLFCIYLFSLIPLIESNEKVKFLTQSYFGVLFFFFIFKFYGFYFFFLQWIFLIVWSKFYNFSISLDERSQKI